ncbi:MAG: tetratricopeptide repeat-containing sensor histidine kinase [Bacteroidales bacterium]|nr:tetratricopeptide repeat-containing sensor histidine kinase [Bacteroidales bacterium]
MKHNQRYFLFLLSGIIFLSVNSLFAQFEEDVLSEQQIIIAPTDSLKEYLNIAESVIYRNPRKGKLFVDQLLKRAEELKDQNSQAYALALNGVYYLTKADKDSCYLYFRDAISRLPEVDDREVHFMINNLFVRVSSRYQQFDTAASYLDKVKKLAEQLDKPKFYAAYYNNRGIQAGNMGRLNESYDYYIKALHYFAELDDKRNRAILNNNIGRVSQELGDHESAISYFEEAMAINRIYGDIYDLGMNYGNIGISYKKLEKYDKALEAFNAAYLIAKENDFRMEMARALLNSAEIHMVKADTSQAEENYLVSLEICQANDIKNGTIFNNLGLASLYYYQKSYAKAWKHLDAAERVAREIQENTRLVEVYDLKVDLLKQESDFEAALVYREKYIALKDSLSELANKQHLLDVKTKYEAEKKSLENLQLRTENKSKNIVIFWRTLFSLVLIVLLAILVVFIYNIRQSRKKLEKANQSLKELNNTITKQNNTLQESNQAKDKLLSVIGHDLRSPFNSILGLLQLMTTDFEAFDKQEQKEILQTLYKQAGDTYQTVENLLQWALSQRGSIKCKVVPTNLSAVIYQEINFYKQKAEAKQIRILFKIDDEAYAMADKELMLIVFRNLINNAIKFSEAGQEIIIKNYQANNWQIVEIEDHGKGMTPDQLAALHADQNLESTKGTHNEGGTGLGLQLVKEFMQMQNGKFELESVAGQGSTAKLCLPLVSSQYRSEE